MRALSAAALLDAWEAGQGRHPVDRALAVLGVAYPEASWEALAGLSLGRRDACLLAVRAHTFGARLLGFACCPQCAEEIEFALDAADLLPPPDAAPPEVQRLCCDEYEVEYRLLTSLDLRAIAGCGDVASARLLLLRRCVMEARRDGAETPADALPETVIAGLSAALDEVEPLADPRLDLVCPACEMCWQMLFDVEAFFWTEIGAAARRLLREIHLLAGAYGWREADILALGAARRRMYLEMVADG